MALIWELIIRIYDLGHVIAFLIAYQTRLGAPHRLARERAEEAMHEARVRVVERHRVEPYDLQNFPLFSNTFREVARNWLVDQYRREEVFRRHARGIAHLRQQLGDPAPELEGRLAQEDIMRAVAELSAEDRQLIALYFLDGLTQPEIAERYGVVTSTICVRLSRALRRLRVLLGAPAVPHTTSAH